MDQQFQIHWSNTPASQKLVRSRSRWLKCLIPPLRLPDRPEMFPYLTTYKNKRHTNSLDTHASQHSLLDLIPHTMTLNDADDT